ncbi:hypothetical protein [Chamaesiphon sp. GL140_3_metabinner_50]|uniref:hypothetical protein n=1 Tax=Chamaesiphon sp. GL140_3_metabinner_50 TaxID=2970812 RepID=UPI0025E32405|nr:hypothetical protein [Chamaesiphon sp. GL140_3_metabinner_50]
MLAKIIDRVGDANPQIFRELKERLTPRNIAIAIVGSLIMQGLVLLYFYGQLPTPDSFNPVNTIINNNYCDFSFNEKGRTYDDLCKLDGAGHFFINWQRWQVDVFTCLSWILPFGLILSSVYMLVADLVQEEKRGTFNFIRLSPQSAQQIFAGKILGVPILVYIATVFILPLHLYLGCSAGDNILFLSSWYLAIGSLWFLLASAAVLYVLLGGVQAILTVIAVSCPLWMPIAAINSFASSAIDPRLSPVSTDVCWFGIAIASNAILFNTFGSICYLAASYGVWQALERRYLNPITTLISKSQSYVANLCWQLWIAGFVIPALALNHHYDAFSLGLLAGMDFTALSLLIPMLLPNKQALQDWSRYRRERVTQKHRQFWRRELVQDLIHNDKSPALLAIALNIAMAMVMWIPVSIVMLFNDFTHGINTLAGIGLGASVILIYSAIAHLGLFLNVKKRKLWITALVAGVILVPSLGAWFLSIIDAPTELVSFLLLFSPFAAMGTSQGGSSIFAAFAAQLAILAVLTHQLQRKIQLSGRSQTQEMGDGSKK